MSAEAEDVRYTIRGFGVLIKNDFEVKRSIGVHIEAKKEASKRPWVAGFVYLGRFRRRACPGLRGLFLVKQIQRGIHMSP